MISYKAIAVAVSGGFHLGMLSVATADAQDSIKSTSLSMTAPRASTRRS